jgi:hypothetical protein
MSVDISDMQTRFSCVVAASPDVSLRDPIKVRRPAEVKRAIKYLDANGKLYSQPRSRIFDGHIESGRDKDILKWGPCERRIAVGRGHRIP